jgi:hypothetical protein
MPESPAVIRNLVKHWRGMPSSDASTDNLASLDIDPAEFQRSRPLRIALDEVCKYLETVLQDDALMAKIPSLPDDLRSRIDNLASEIDNVLKEMVSVWKPNPQTGLQQPRWDSAKFESMAQLVKSRYADLFVILEPLRQFKPSDVQKQIDELRGLIVQSGLERESAKGTTAELEQAQREAAAYVLSEITIRELDDTIAIHKKAARNWLFILIISAVIAFRIAWWVNIPNTKFFGWDGIIFPQPAVPLTSLEALQTLGRKILLLSAAFFIPLLALRVYYTNLHNLVINRQRKISVNAFTKLYALMKDSDPTTKAELVKQAAQTIFTQGATGFLSKYRSDPELFGLVASLLRTGSKTG